MGNLTFLSAADKKKVLDNVALEINNVFQLIIENKDCRATFNPKYPKKKVIRSIEGLDFVWHQYKKIDQLLSGLNEKSYQRFFYVQCEFLVVGNLKIIGEEIYSALVRLYDKYEEMAAEKEQAAQGEYDEEEIEESELDIDEYDIEEWCKPSAKGGLKIKELRKKAQEFGVNGGLTSRLPRRVLKRELLKLLEQ